MIRGPHQCLAFHDGDAEPEIIAHSPIAGHQLRKFRHIACHGNRIDKGPAHHQILVNLAGCTHNHSPVLADRHRRSKAFPRDRSRGGENHLSCSQVAEVEVERPADVREATVVGAWSPDDQVIARKRERLTEPAGIGCCWFQCLGDLPAAAGALGDVDFRGATGRDGGNVTVYRNLTTEQITVRTIAWL